MTSRRAKRWIATATAALAALSIASTANAAAPGGLDIPGTILRSGDYNTGSISQWSGHQKVAPDRLQVLTSPVREGSHAARFEVRRGDDPLCQAGYGCYGDRSEVQMSTGEREGQERWYSWSTMFASDFPSYSNWQVFSQWHSTQDGSPPIAFYARNDSLVLMANRSDGSGNFLSYDELWVGPMKRGEWQDIRLRVKWSGSDSVGFVELWIDGVAQRLTNGQTRRYVRTMYPGYGNYFKQGYYRQGGLSATGVVYHDGFRMSDGQGAMTSPPPPSSTTSPPPPSTAPAPAPSVSMTPTSASVAAGATRQFTATVANASGGVTWSVNGVAGGNATVGTISSAGLYTAPAAVPSGGTVTVKATSVASPTAGASATVTVTAPAAAPAPAPAPAPAGRVFFSDAFETVSPAASSSPWTLRLDRGNQYAWSTLYKSSGSRSTAFAQASSTGQVAYITRAVPAGQDDLSVTARVYLRTNTLGSGRTRGLVRVTKGDGRVRGPRHEMGLMRTAAGLRWAVWSVDRDGRYTAAAVGTQAPVLGRWTTVTLRTQWDRADARARVGIAGGEAFGSAAVNLSGVTPTNVDVGNVWSRSDDTAIVYFDDVTATDAGILATTAGRASTRRIDLPATSRAPKGRSRR